MLGEWLVELGNHWEPRIYQHLPTTCVWLAIMGYEVKGIDWTPPKFRTVAVFLPLRDFRRNSLPWRPSRGLQTVSSLWHQSMMTVQIHGGISPPKETSSSFRNCCRYNSIEYTLLVEPNFIGWRVRYEHHDCHWGRSSLRAVMVLRFIGFKRCCSTEVWKIRRHPFRFKVDMLKNWEAWIRLYFLELRITEQGTIYMYRYQKSQPAVTSSQFDLHKE